MNTISLVLLSATTTLGLSYLITIMLNHASARGWRPVKLSGERVARPEGDEPGHAARLLADDVVSGARGSLGGTVSEATSPQESVLARGRRIVQVDELAMMKIIGAIGCIAVGAGFGYEFADYIIMPRWPLWSWLLAVAFCAYLLLPAERPTVALGQRWLRIPLWGWLAGVLVVGLLLRATALETIPGGLHVDEAGTADFSKSFIFANPHETINPFTTGINSQPTLYHYLIWISFKILGFNSTGLRMTSAIGGTLGLLATFWAVSLFQGRRAAALTTVLMLGYHYHIHWSRIGLNNIWDTLWVPLIVASFTWGWRQRWSGGAVLAGLALGFSQYFYGGNKISLFLLAYLIVSFWRRERDHRWALGYVGKLLLMAACVAIPIALFAKLRPDIFFDRSRTVYGWQPSLIQEKVGDVTNLWAYFRYQLWHNAGAFTVFPDGTGFYGPGVPYLIGISAPLFVVGFLWALYRRQLVPVLWVVLVVFFGGVMLSGAPSSSHHVAVIPAICWLVATPLDWLYQQGRRWVATSALVAILATDLAFYFLVYVPSSPRDLSVPFELVGTGR